MSDPLELARKSLLAYCSLTNENYKMPKHIVRMAKILERVERGELKRVIITIPPRHGKSMLCSQYFPAWYMGRNPEKYLIAASYGQELSDDFGRKVRDQLADSLFKATFPETILRTDSKAAARFETTKGGTYFGVGAGGPITGRGAHLLLIDDPIKNREDADSETMRTKLYDWFRSVAYTRLMPGGAVIIIMTRWHEEDLIGQILRNVNAEGWEKIDLKAIDDEGNPLWPEAYDLETLEDIRRTVFEYDWACLYQQDPIPSGGIIVKSDWMGIGQEKDYSVKLIGVDPAIGQNQINDETAICVGGLGFGSHAPIDEIETVSGHFTFHEQIKIISALQEKHQADLVGIEDVAYQRALIQELSRLGVPVAPLPTLGKDKVARLMGVSHFMTAGRTRVNSPALRQQALRFRGEGEKNDLVDAWVNLLMLVRDYTTERNRPPVNKYKDMDPYQAAMQRNEELARRKQEDAMQGSWGEDDLHGFGDLEAYEV